jgi:2-polyprenyl-3-methyl-5-hydroxy-6-metoxy-1,4-benzoquinol methylase
MKESAPELLHDRNWHSSLNEIEKFYKLPRIKSARNWVSAHQPQNLLDIGCGAGYLAARIKNDHPQIEIHGLDFSKTAIDHASSFLDKSWRLNIDLEDIPAADEYYDAVICMEVLEHVYDITHVLKEIRRVLKPGGKALISVPNLAYWRFRLQLLIGVLPHPEVFNPEHIHAFVFSSLQEKLAQTGLFVSRCWGYGNRVRILAENYPQLFSSTIFLECHS